MKPPGLCTVGLQWTFQVAVATQALMFIGTFLYVMVIPDVGHHPVGALIAAMIVGFAFSWVTIAVASLAGLVAMSVTGIRRR